MPANLENSAVATGLEKVSFHSNPKERQCKECSNYCTIALISHTNKVMLKIIQTRLQQYVSHELPDVQAGFRKGRGTRDQISNIHCIMKKAREFQKNIYFCLLCGSEHTVENSERDGNTRPPDLVLRNLCAAQEATVRTGYGTKNWLQIGKGVHQSCILSPCLFNILCEMLG